MLWISYAKFYKYLETLYCHKVGREQKKMSFCFWVIPFLRRSGIFAPEWGVLSDRLIVNGHCRFTKSFWTTVTKSTVNINVRRNVQCTINAC